MSEMCSSVNAEDHGDSRVTGSSCLALRSAVSKLNRLDDFFREKIGTGFFSEVFKVTHKVTGQVMVLKMNLLRSNRPNMLKEVQLLNQLSHPNILGFMGVCVHEGQLHALTEYINSGRLEQIIQDKSVALPFSVRMKLALDIAKGMEYLHSKDIFHRDLTSKNIFVKTNEETGEMTAVVGDFGFAAKIPNRCGYRLTTVGSAYWMSPECLKGEWYDQSSDVFSYGIILCELIARVDADPDVLTRTENFGLDYIAFAKLCQAEQTPSDFLKLTFTCCSYEAKKRPSFASIVKQLENLLWNAKNPRTDVADSSCSAHNSKDTSHSKLCHRRSLSDEVIRVLGETMAQQDVHYKPTARNPFANIPAFKGVKKIVEPEREKSSESDVSVESSTVVAEPVIKPSKVLESIRCNEKMDQASMLDAIFAGRCFSSSPNEKSRLKKDDGDASCSGKGCRREGRWRTQPLMPPSLPSSPTFSRRAHSNKPQPSLLNYRTCSSGSNLPFLDDHAIPTVLYRRGSCESGFFSSVGEDFCHPGNDLIASSITLSSSSAASSLLLDSGCCEGFCLRYCQHIRSALNAASSDSAEDVSIASDQNDEKLKCTFTPQHHQQIQKMVEYFERKGAQPSDYYRHLRYERRPRRSATVVCEGAVRSKLQLFDKK